MLLGRAQFEVPVPATLEQDIAEKRGGGNPDAPRAAAVRLVPAVHEQGRQQQRKERFAVAQIDASFFQRIHAGQTPGIRLAHGFFAM